MGRDGSVSMTPAPSPAAHLVGLPRAPRRGSDRGREVMSTRRELLSFDDRDPRTPPPDRGRLWYDDEIPTQFFGGRVSRRWVRAHLPRGKGLKIGRGWAWYEADVLAW